MTVQLALYKGRGLIGNYFIRAWTRSKYSHCELVIDGMSYSSSMMDGGVRKKEIEMKPDNWDLIEIPWASAQEVLDYFEQTDPHKYSYIGLITSQLFNLNIPGHKTKFCSEWCAAAVKIPDASKYNPATLGELVEFINETLSNEKVTTSS